jgi:hypothetical protein
MNLTSGKSMPKVTQNIPQHNAKKEVSPAVFNTACVAVPAVLLYSVYSYGEIALAAIGAGYIGACGSSIVGLFLNNKDTKDTLVRYSFLAGLAIGGGLGYDHQKNVVKQVKVQPTPSVKTSKQGKLTQNAGDMVLPPTAMHLNDAVASLKTPVV